jgi:2'-5' RNA ligase
MSRIAIDAVLLPSDEVAARAIEANRELAKQSPGKIVLDKENCLPHVSLAMGCINESDIAKIEGILQETAQKHNPGLLTIAGIHVGTSSSGDLISLLELKRTKSLQLLHEEVMRVLAPYLSHDVTTEMLLSAAPVAESTLLWIKDYPEKSSFERFFPHITLGYGRLENFSFPARFAASGLALCHLGNHCTCRKILASAEFPR